MPAGGEGKKERIKKEERARQQTLCRRKSFQKQEPVLFLRSNTGNPFSRRRE